MRPQLARTRGNRRETRDLTARVRPLPWLSSIALVLLVVGAGGAIAFKLLTGWAGQNSAGLTPTENATLQLEAIKTALTVAAALGAGITLLLAIRRQSTTEHEMQVTQRNAQEQLITTQYIAAANQLGDDKAPVRLAGLYALDRLGDANPKLRQTVIDLICSYLRMPFELPDKVRHTGDDAFFRGLSSATNRIAEKMRSELGQLHQAGTAPKRIDKIERQLAELEAIERLALTNIDELHVRRAAQQLLSKRTTLPDFWRSEHNEPLDIDLTGATLTDLDLANARINRVNMSAAQVHGITALSNADVTGQANFSGASFFSAVFLDGAIFHAFVDFRFANFYASASLAEATYGKDLALNFARIPHEHLELPKNWRARRDPFESGKFLLVHIDPDLTRDLPTSNEEEVDGIPF